MDTNVLGKPLNRIEGRLKVTGEANYAADCKPEGLVYAYGIRSEIATGVILSVDATEAEAAPGVLKVIHALDAPQLLRCPESVSVGERRAPLEDRKIYYAGQFIGLVVAETLAQARWAAGLVYIKTKEDPDAQVDMDRAKSVRKTKSIEEKIRGDAETGFAQSAHTIDRRYDSPVEAHCAMELHAATAHWEEGRLFIDDSTQHVVGQQEALAHTFGIPESDVEVRSRFIGGGFGSKLFLWPHSILAAEASRQLQRPVQFMLDRSAHFATAGHRPFTQQRVRIGADVEGRFQSIQHDALSHTSMVHDYEEDCVGATRSLYGCANVSTTQKTIQLNTGSPTPMRGPGETPGLWALESAIDELAVEMEVDPLELRLRNIAQRDEGKDLPWSINLHERCLREAAQRFGWERRDAKIGSMRDGTEVIGWGMSSMTWSASRLEATVSVDLLADGSARISCATQDIGTGTYTVLAQIVAELTGLPFERIDVRIGNSRLPTGPISGGSMLTGTIVPAVADATDKVVSALLDLAVDCEGGPFKDAKSEDLEMREGCVVFKDKDKSGSLEIAEILNEARLAYVNGQAEAKPGNEEDAYSFRSFGGHFVEVRWDSGLGRLRVSRVTTVVDAGRIINDKTARNQVYGSIVMGVGMAKLEEVVYDKRTGRPVTDNLADYLVPVMTDVPDMDLSLLDVPDPHFGRYGARGIGEIGLTGVAPALANAVYHATGKRIRSLPIRIDDLIL